jgi:hypothetical protein
MTQEQVELLAKAIGAGFHEVAQAIRTLGYHLSEDTTLAEYVYHGLEKAARIIKGLDK